MGACIRPRTSASFGATYYYASRGGNNDRLPPPDDKSWARAASLSAQRATTTNGVIIEPNTAPLPPDEGAIIVDPFAPTEPDSSNSSTTLDSTMEFDNDEHERALARARLTRNMSNISEERSSLDQVMDMSTAYFAGPGSRSVSQSRIGMSSAPSPNPSSLFARPDLFRLPSREKTSIVLVVDVHLLTRQTLSRWMANSAYTEISCASGQQALDILQPEFGVCIHNIDVILCDLSILVPSNSGMNSDPDAEPNMLLLDWVISHPIATISSIPVIVMTETNVITSQGLERIIRRGARDALQKPLNKSAFLHSLSILFRARAQQSFISSLKQKGDEFKAATKSNILTNGGVKLGTLRSPVMTSMTALQMMTSTPTVASRPPSTSLTRRQSSPPLVGPMPSLALTRVLYDEGVRQSSNVVKKLHRRSRSSPQPILLDAAGVRIPSPLLAKSPRSNADPQSPSSSTPIRILLVETDLQVVASLRLWIETIDVQLHHVTSCAEAVAAMSGTTHPILSKAPSTDASSTTSSSAAPSRSLLVKPSLSQSTSSDHWNNHVNATLVRPTSAQMISPHHATAAPVVIHHHSPTLAPIPHGARSPQRTSPGHSSRAVANDHSMPSMTLSPAISTKQASTSVSFDIELIIVNQALLTTSGPRPGLNEPTSSYDTTASTDAHDDDMPKSVSSLLGGENAASTKSSSSASTNPAKQLISLSLRTASGTRRRLPVVLLCDELGPSPSALSMLNRVALSTLSAPLSRVVVARKIQLLIAIVSQQREAAVLEKRLLVYQQLLKDSEDGVKHADADHLRIITSPSRSPSRSPVSVRSPAHEMGYLTVGGHVSTTPSRSASPLPERQRSVEGKEVARINGAQAVEGERQKSVTKAPTITVSDSPSDAPALTITITPQIQIARKRSVVQAKDTTAAKLRLSRTDQTL